MRLARYARRCRDGLIPTRVACRRSSAYYRSWNCDIQFIHPIRSDKKPSQHFAPPVSLGNRLDRGVIRPSAYGSRREVGSGRHMDSPQDSQDSPSASSNCTQRRDRRRRLLSHKLFEVATSSNDYFSSECSPASARRPASLPLSPPAIWPVAATARQCHIPAMQCCSGELGHGRIHQSSCRVF